MSYLIHPAAPADTALDVMIAGLVMTTYSAGATYTYQNAEGTMSLTIASDEITLPTGRYMCEAWPYVDVATTSDQILYKWQRDSGAGFTDEGILGQIQVINDAEGERDVAIAQFDVASSDTIRLIVDTLTSSGVPVDAGGLIVIWRYI
jgi:hypothetical protein